MAYNILSAASQSRSNAAATKHYRTQTMTVASMTGYAVASGPTPLGTVTLECRSVNSRFLDLTLRLNEDLRFADPLIRETIQKRIARGKVEIRGYITPDENAVPARINAAVLNRIVELQQTVLDAVPNARELSVSDLLSMPGVMVNDRLDQDAVSSAVLAVLNNALDAFTATRAREGEALASVLLNNCQQIEEVVTEVKGRMPEILAHIEGKLKERLENALCTALTETSTLTREEVSDRIRQEVTLYAMRMDVEEEINRLYTHVTEVRRILNKGGAVGRRLDFVVQEMNRLGLMVDLSHGAESSFYDALELSTTPIVCSHSSCRALCNVPRNLTDEQMKALARKGGVAQVTLYKGFLREDGEASILDAIEHLNHMVNIMGVEHVGIGTDFDGDGGIPGCASAAEVINFTRRLLAERYNDTDIAGVWGGNFLRVMQLVQDSRTC